MFSSFTPDSGSVSDQPLLIIGQAGVGKSFVACALGHKACRDNRSVLYHRLPRFVRCLAARAR